MGGVPYLGVLRIDQLHDPVGARCFARALVSPNLEFDVGVRKIGGGFRIYGDRIADREYATYRLTVDSALAVLPDRGERA